MSAGRPTILVLAPLAALAIACGGEADRPPADVGGGGAGGGGGNEDPIDGGPGDGDGDAGDDALVGQLCAVRDLRAPTSCAVFDLFGVPIVARPGGAMTFTDREGYFTLADAGATSRLEIADGAGELHPARLDPRAWSGVAGVVAPIIPELAWEELLAAIGVLELDDDGSVVVYVVDGASGTPRAGAVLDAVIGASNPPLYAGIDEVDWLPDGETDATGAVLVVSVPAGPATLTAVRGLEEGSVTVDVAPGALTFAVLPL